MAAHALSIPAPSALPANDEGGTPKADLWRQIIILFTAFDERAGVIAWQVRLAGENPCRFLEDVRGALRERGLF